MTKIRAAGFADVYVERTDPGSPFDIAREAVYRGDRLIGHVSYVAASTRGGTMYGWRPSDRRTRLTSKREAIQRLGGTNISPGEDARRGEREGTSDDTDC